jgi:hypothetical protein
MQDELNKVLDRKEQIVKTDTATGGTPGNKVRLPFLIFSHLIVDKDNRAHFPSLFFLTLSVLLA